MNFSFRVLISTIRDQFTANYAPVLVLCSLPVVYLWLNFNPELSPAYTDMAGQATMKNISITARVVFFLQAIFLFITVFFLFWIIVNYVRNKVSYSNFGKAIRFFAPYSLLVLVNQLVLQNVSYLYFVFFLIALIFFYIIQAVVSTDNLFFLQTITLTASFFCTIFLFDISVPKTLLIIVQLTFLLLLQKLFYPVLLPFFKKAQQSVISYIITAALTTGFILFYIIFYRKLNFYYLFEHLDITKSLRGIPYLYIIWPAVISVCCFFIFYLLRKKISFKVIQWFAAGSLFIIMQFSENFLETVLIGISFCILMIAYEFLSVKKKRELKKTTYIYSSIMDFILACGVFYLLNEIGVVFFTDRSRFFLPLFFVIFSLAKSFLQFNRTVFYKVFFFIAASPVVLLLAKEGFMVLNSRGVFTGHIGYFVFLILGLAGTFFFSYRIKSFKRLVDIYFVFAVTGFAVYNSYYHLWIGQPDFFEDASSANAINRFLYQHEVPMIHHFSPHNFNDFITGALYAFLNHDASFGYKIYSCLYGVLFAVYYFFLKNLFASRFYAFIYVFLCAIIWQQIPLYHTIGIAFFTILVWYYKANSYLPKTIGVSLLLLLLVFFRVDTGFAITGAAVPVIFSIKYFYTSWKMKTIWLVSFFCFLLLFTISAVVYTFGWHQVMKAASLTLLYIRSSQSWGFEKLTAIINYKFTFQYFVFPAVILTILFYVLLKLPKIRKTAHAGFAGLSVIFLCCYYLFNFQRGLVRHSFMENKDTGPSSFLFLIIPVFVYFLCTLYEVKKSRLFFLFAFSSSCFIYLFKFPGVRQAKNLYSFTIDKTLIDNSLSYADSVIARFRLLSKNDTNIYIFTYPLPGGMNHRYKRNSIPDSLQSGLKLKRRGYNRYETEELFNSSYHEIKKLIDSGVIKGYVDEVCYRPLLGYYLNNKSTHFFNQGVHFYHNDVLQKEFISELRKSGSNYILVNTVSADSTRDHLDGVPHSIRHHLIFKYLYKNYNPYVILDHKTLWVKKVPPLDTSMKKVLEITKYDSLFDLQNQQALKPEKRYIFVVTGSKASKNDTVWFNGGAKARVSFRDEYNNKVFILCEKERAKIASVRLKYPVSKFEVFECDYFPDLFSTIPVTYHLEMLPLVQSVLKNKRTVLQEINFEAAQSDTIIIPVRNQESIRFADLYFKIANNALKKETLIFQYFKGDTYLGKFDFYVQQGNGIRKYLLSPATQLNWVKQGPDRIMLVKPKGVKIINLSFLKDDDISY